MPEQTCWNQKNEPNNMLLERKTTVTEIGGQKIVYSRRYNFYISEGALFHQKIEFDRTQLRKRFFQKVMVIEILRSLPILECIRTQYIVEIS